MLLKSFEISQWSHKPNFDLVKSLPVITREDFRKISVIKEACVASIMGLGFQSYEEGLKILLRGSEQK